MSLSNISITSLQTKQQFDGAIDLESIQVGRSMDVYLDGNQGVIRTGPIRGWLKPEDVMTRLYVMDYHGKRFLIRPRGM